MEYKRISFERADYLVRQISTDSCLNEPRDGNGIILNIGNIQRIPVYETIFYVALKKQRFI